MVDGSDNVLEEILVLRAQTGDADSFCQLFKQYNHRLLFYIRKLLDRSVEAEDTLQDVWIKVYRKLPNLKDETAFKPWLFRIAHNEAVSKLRKIRASPETRIVDDPVFEEGADSIQDDLFRSFDPRRVNNALQALSLPHREVLTLRFLEQLTCDEIADVVGCSSGTVRSRIHYAKVKLKKLLVEARVE